MLFPKHARAGQNIRAADINTIRDGARVGANVSANDGLEARGTVEGRSIALSPQPDVRDHAIQAEQTSAETAPIYGVVDIYESEGGYGRAAVPLCRRPPQSGFGKLGITLMSGAQNTAPYVQTSHIQFVQYTGTTAVGQRLGGKKDSYLAQPDRGGPFFVLELPTVSAADQALLETGASIARVLITNERIDAKMVDCDAVDATVSGPYHTIIYKGFTVAETSPGRMSTG